MLQVADVVFFRMTNTVISKIIAKITNSEYTHVGIVTEILPNGNPLIVEADRFIKTREIELRFDPSRHAIYRIFSLTNEQKRNIVAYSRSMIGTSYDYLQIIGFILRLVFNVNTGNIFNRTNYLICSELIDKSLYTSGVKRINTLKLGNVTPQELLTKYPFTLVNTMTLNKTLQ